MITIRVGDPQPELPIWWVGLRGRCPVCTARFELEASDSISAVCIDDLELACETPNCLGRVSFRRLRIATHPASQSVAVGQPVSFTVVAIGLNLTYQWKFNDVDIVGATEATYSIASAQLVHAGSYMVVVTSNDGASKTSDPAVLTVA